MEMCHCREYRFPKDASKNERVCDVMNATVGMVYFISRLSSPPKGYSLQWLIRGIHPEVSTFLRLKVYKRVEISDVKVYEWVKKSIIYLFKGALN